MGLIVALTSLVLLLGACILSITIVARGGPMGREVARALSVSGPFPERSAFYQDFAPRNLQLAAVPSASQCSLSEADQQDEERLAA